MLNSLAAAFPASQQGQRTWNPHWPHYMRRSKRVLVCEVDDDQTNKRRKLWPHYVIGVFSNLLLKIKGNYPALEHSATQYLIFLSSITAPRSVTRSQLLCFLPLLVCLFHFLIYFVMGFTSLWPISLYFQSFICSYYLTHNGTRASRTCKRNIGVCPFSWQACCFLNKLSKTTLHKFHMYFRQEVIEAKDPQYMECVSPTQKRLSQILSFKTVFEKKKKPQWMKKQAIFWVDSGNPQDGARPRLRCEGPWTVKWWRGQLQNRWRMKDGSLCGKTLKEMNCQKKLDGNESKTIKARCESLQQYRYFNGSTAEAYKQLFKCGFALNKPWIEIKTAISYGQVCAKFMSIICAA